MRHAPPPRQTVNIQTTDPHANRKGLILAVNAGSSSLKISLYRNIENGTSHSQITSEPVELLLVSNITNISAPPASFSFTLGAHHTGHQVKKEPVDSIRDHTSAFAHFLDYLKDEAKIDRSEIVHVCHRVVHGGDYFEPVVITSESYDHIERLSDLAPLHNGAALSVIKTCIEILPSATSIAYFDTSFHRSMPPYIASYAIDQTIAKKRGLKKYGFHGLSYAYILRAVAAYLKRDPNTLNLIVMHLGSGASVCAIKDGKSLDTSMGLTPLTGLPGATRAGGVDPSLIFHYTNKAGRMSHDRSQAVNVHVTQAEEILNKKSGWKAITGTTDFGEVVKNMKTNAEKVAQGQATEDEAKWAMAFNLFTDRVIDFVGAYYLKLEGKVDAVVFSGGIGERSVELREFVMGKLACVGISFDKDSNQVVDEKGGEVVEIGKPEDERKVLVCRTDEQLEMARECFFERAFWEES
ncbi:acetate and butyrate kinase [Irpex rosettiformis]|uniref:Acetate and butyrate kinase n=1 Tax=Irpex rosettiformis TaxID=378272 RepID=A0ACB8UAC4_9APHY|nr:acetate and butyrate kinase [Irpex rosettiformis]